MKHIKKLPNNSFEIFRFDKKEYLDELLNDLHALKIDIDRDVIIESDKQSEYSLTAVKGDFWFHTDGVFLKNSPHWILIQLLEFNSGGELELLNFSHISATYYNDLYFFGKDKEGIKSKLFNNNAFRYRKDYMQPIDGNKNFIALNIEIERIYIEKKIEIFGFSKFNCILIDNWNLMHRRKDFDGKRTIRRIWFS